jgi:putative glutamine amidotransferase
MGKPIIGITPQYDYERNRVWIGPNYLEAIRSFGGIPILLPLEISAEDLEEATKHCDGFLYTGGPDIDPFLFGEETIKGGGVVIPQRDQMEEHLFHIAMKSMKPVLGICRGIQILNVLLGGTLYQDIPTQFMPKWISPKEIHNETTFLSKPYSMDEQFQSSPNPNIQLDHYQQSGNSVLTHSIFINKHSPLYEIVGKDYMRVNSFHHEGIKDLAPSLKVAALSPDSLTEAMYLPEHPFFLGVQWHPEHLFHTDSDAKALFCAFIEACK